MSSLGESGTPTTARPSRSSSFSSPREPLSSSRRRIAVADRIPFAAPRLRSTARTRSITGPRLGSAFTGGPTPKIVSDISLRVGGGGAAWA
jgi:hypothetical protein